jgi:hypothetical protein
MLRQIAVELRQHAPFTILGATTGLVIMAATVVLELPSSFSHRLFWVLHPLHVLFSALATTSMYRLRRNGGPWATIAIGYAGSVGIATLSDCLIPYAGEWLLDLPNRGFHIGFIEKWWLVHPLAALGVFLGWIRPRTTLPHAGHVLLSTWASLFHMTLALGDTLSPVTTVLIGVFLFFAVWIPCCASDIVFPLLFGRTATGGAAADPEQRYEALGGR